MRILRSGFLRPDTHEGRLFVPTFSLLRILLTIRIEMSSLFLEMNWFLGKLLEADSTPSRLKLNKFANMVCLFIN